MKDGGEMSSRGLWLSIREALLQAKMRHIVHSTDLIWAYFVLLFYGFYGVHLEFFDDAGGDIIKLNKTPAAGQAL